MPEGGREREEKDGGKAERFKVTDRRHFTAEGDRRQGIGEDADDAAPALRSGRAFEPGREPEAPGFERKSLDEPEGVDFTMLVNAMAQPALLFLGEIPHPATGKPAVDLEQAKIQIDMLGLLGVKCRGNLTQQEEKLLERILYQLRMLYVARTSRSG